MSAAGGRDAGAPTRVSSPRVLLVTLALLLSGCAHLDFGGDDEKPWEIRTFLDGVPDIGEEDPENPGFDRDGNMIPDPETMATFAFPDVHAGTAWINGDEPKVTPTVNVELLEFKVPYLRWFVVAPGAGSEEAHFYVGKRLTSIVEITVGPMLARRFDENDWTWGFQGTLLKF